MRVATIVRIALLAAMALLVWYLRRWGLPPLVLLAVVLVAAAWFGIWFMNTTFKRMLATPFKLKGAALEGAGIILHSVKAAAPPTAERLAASDSGSDDPESDEPSPPPSPSTRPPTLRHWYHVELTIVPLPDTSAPVATEGEAATPHFRFWDPLELVLVPTGCDGKDPQALDAAEQDEELCELRDIEVHRGKDYRRVDRELRGSQRLRLYIGVVPGYVQLELQYYLARFGEIPLPPAA